MILPSVSLSRLAWRGEASAGVRVVAEETAIAITYNRVTHAVMMASPADLEDFAVGFSLAEEIVPEAGAIEEISVVEGQAGIELRLWIAPALMARLDQRRRRLAGATGCGMCGLESLDEAMRVVPSVPAGRGFTAEAIEAACASLAPAQALNQATRAVHGAAFWTLADGLVALREDVGRHNALDKLAGALARAGRRPDSGLLLLTSRISIELVQKAARMAAPMLVAVSAPTALAVRTAAAAGMTLIGVARPDGFEVFTHPHRVDLGARRAVD